MNTRNTKTKLLIGLSLLTAVLAGCTDNQRARQFGGTTTEELPANTKLVIATWKQDNLWMLTRKMRDDEKAESYEFIESSSFGMMNGKVVIKERKDR